MADSAALSTGQGRVVTSHASDCPGCARTSQPTRCDSIGPHRLPPGKHVPMRLSPSPARSDSQRFLMCLAYAHRCGAVDRRPGPRSGAAVLESRSPEATCDIRVAPRLRRVLRSGCPTRRQGVECGTIGDAIRSYRGSRAANDVLRRQRIGLLIRRRWVREPELLAERGRGSASGRTDECLLSSPRPER